MKNDLFVDTSGWSTYLDPRANIHATFVALVRQTKAKRGRLVTTNYVIAELVALLSSRYRFPRQQVITGINGIKHDASVEIIHIDESIDNQGWRLLERYLDKEWSLVDATSFTVMDRFRITRVLTTDRHFTQAGFICVPE